MLSIIVYIVVGNVDDDLLFYIVCGCFVFLVIFSVVYIMETCCGKTSKFLSRAFPAEHVASHLQIVRQQAPKIMFHCECYHYEERLVTDNVSSTDSQGNTKVEHRYRRERVKVVSYRNSEAFQYSRCVDRSPEGALTPQLVGGFPAARLNLTMNWYPGDLLTKQFFDQQFNSFYMMNCMRDVYIEMWTQVKVDGFESCILGFTGARPFWMRRLFFYCFTLMGCSWIYRYYLTRRTANCSYAFDKLVYVQ